MNNTSLEMFNATVMYQEEYIWIKPVCDFFEINYENQTRKINNDKIMANHSTKMSNSLLFGDNYKRLLVDKIGFIRWIQLINPVTIKESLREKFVKFQEMIFDYLFGSIKKEATTKVSYRRLKKLENLKDKITLEIKREKRKLSNYLETKFQTKLDFSQDVNSVSN
jgi:hypothetical protein